MSAMKWMSCSEAGKVIVHDVRAGFASVATSPCNLVCVLGKAREGKSFLMNCLATHDLFEVSNLHTPCTQGVDLSGCWIENEVWLNGVASSNDHASMHMKVGFVDAEGQGDKDIACDANLICPVLLVSKCVLFNWKGDVQKDQILNSLGVMAKAAQNVSFENSSNSIFGHLHIVFRDWQCGENDELSAAAVQDLLFNFESQGPDADTRNRIRKVILNAFSSVRVWLFEPPSEFTKDLKQKLVFEKTSSAFRVQVLELREALAQQLKEPTCVAGNVLTGRAYGPLTEQIAEALNSGLVVLPSSAYINMMRQDVQKIFLSYKHDLLCAVQNKAAQFKTLLDNSTSEDNRWPNFGTAECKSEFAVLVQTLGKTYQSRIAGTEGNLRGSPGSPIATILLEYATQTQGANDSVQQQFLALFHQQFTQWLKEYNCSKESALNQTISEAGDVTEALLSTVSVQDIAPLHSGEDPVDSYAQSVAAEIFRSMHMQRVVLPWLLSKLAPFRDCVVCSEDSCFYFVSPTADELTPAEDAQLCREVVFFNDLHRAIDEQSEVFKAQWREELRGLADRAERHAAVDTVSDRRERADAHTAAAATLEGLAPATSHSQPPPLTASAPPRKASLSTLMSRLAVSVDEQRTRAQSWARCSLRLRFDSKKGAGKGSASKSSSKLKKPHKSFAQQRADALEFALKKFKWDTAQRTTEPDAEAESEVGAGEGAWEEAKQRAGPAVELPLSRDQDEINISEDNADDFVHVEHDNALPSLLLRPSASASLRSAAPVVPVVRPSAVNPPSRAVVPASDCILGGSKSNAGARLAAGGLAPAEAHPAVASTTAAGSSRIPPVSPLATSTQQEPDRPHTPLLPSDCDSDSDSESSEDIIAELGVVADTGDRERNRAAVVNEVVVGSGNRRCTAAASAPAKFTPVSTRFELPIVQQLTFRQRCLVDIYAQSDRADPQRVAMFLAQEKSILDENITTLRTFEDRVCKALRITNRHLSAVLVDGSCSLLCELDFNTNFALVPTRVSSPVPGGSTVGADVSSPAVSEPSCASPCSPASTDTTPTLSTISTAQSSAAFQVVLKDPIIGKASCIFFNLFDRDRFLRVKIVPSTASTRNGGMRRRYSRLLVEGIHLGGRVYHFLCGEGKDRTDCHAYFFATEDDIGELIPISVQEVRQALANFVPIDAGTMPQSTSVVANPSKMNARLMLGFSPTFPALQLVDSQVHLIPDVAGEVGIMTDGCGFISASLLQDLPFGIANGVMFCKRRTGFTDCSTTNGESRENSSVDGAEGELTADVALPNTVQVRFSGKKGLFKGCLIVTTDTTLCPHNGLVMRESMRKVAGAAHIHSNAPCTLFVNRTFERAAGVDSSAFTNATAALAMGGKSSPWTAQFSVDMCLLLCHLGLPVDVVLKAAQREAQNIQNISSNRGAAMELVHRTLRRADRRASGAEEDSGSDDEGDSLGAAVGSTGVHSATDPSIPLDTGENFQSAKYSLCLTAENAAVKALHFLVAGHSLQEPQLQKYLSGLQTVAMKRLKRLKFRLPNSGYMVGVPDPYGALAENEVFVYLPLGEGEVRTTPHIHSCEVLVSRNPMHHPGDIRKLRAVHCAPLSALCGQSSNPVIFFSMQGARSQADKMGGGDFDGDEYCVIFNTTIVSAVTPVAPYEASDYPAVQIGTAYGSSTHTAPSGRDALGLELLGSLLHHANTSNIGMYSNAWRAFADRDPSSAEARVCDHLARLALDAAKTGFEGTSVKLPKVMCRPHYMTELKDVPHEYHSTSVMGVVMDMIDAKTGDIAPSSAPPITDKDIYTVIENGAVIFDVEQEIAWHGERQQRWALWDRWKEHFVTYRMCMRGTSGVSSTSNNGDSSTEYESVKRRFIDTFDTEAANLSHTPRYAAFTGYTGRRVLAAIVYHLTYENCSSFANTFRVTFCWEICPTELHDNKKRSVALRTRQHEHDLLPAAYFTEMYNFP